METKPSQKIIEMSCIKRFFICLNFILIRLSASSESSQQSSGGYLILMLLLGWPTQPVCLGLPLSPQKVTCPQETPLFTSGVLATLFIDESFFVVVVVVFIFFYFFLILKSLILTCIPKHLKDDVAAKQSQDSDSDLTSERTKRTLIQWVSKREVTTKCPCWCLCILILSLWSLSLSLGLNFLKNLSVMSNILSLLTSLSLLMSLYSRKFAGCYSWKIKTNFWSAYCV